MKMECEMAGALEDFISFHGTPNALYSDNAKAQIGHAIQEILRMYLILDFQFKPHCQLQNLAEHWI
jgi:transposase InsO family protein